MKVKQQFSLSSGSKKKGIYFFLKYNFPCNNQCELLLIEKNLLLFFAQNILNLDNDMEWNESALFLGERKKEKKRFK